MIIWRAVAVAKISGRFQNAAECPVVRIVEGGHILKSHDIYMLFPSYPRFQAGIHLKERQPGLPITNAGNGTFFSSSPQVVGGDLSEQTQDGFPITNVGNDDDGEGFRINNVGR